MTESITRSATNARRAQRRSGSLFGRAHEQRAARLWLRRVEDGYKGLILLDGARGSGRTALLADISETASTHGFHVIRAPFDKYRGLLLAETLLRDAYTRPVRPRESAGEAGPAVADLVEKFLAHGRTDVDASAPPGRAEPPVLIALDDIAWNDPLVRRSLPGLLCASGSRRVLWLLAGAGPLIPMPPTPGDGADVELLSLDPLEERYAVRMAADRLGGAPDPMLTRIIEACGGHPGLLSAALDAVLADNRLRVQDGVARLAAHSVPGAVLKSLLEDDPRLSAQAKALVCALAVRGEAPCIGEFTRLPAESSLAQLEALREVVDAGVLDVDDDVLRFRHPLVRAGAQLLVARPSEPKTPATRAQIARLSRPTEPLSPTERSIVRLVATGLTNGQVATRISLSPHTVNFHLRKIFRKAGVSSRVELAGVHRQLLLADD